jgi:two-component system chemotaxis response regulator CheB
VTGETDQSGYSGRKLAWTPEPAIVALVCSAGGLGALKDVLGGLPHDFPAAVIVLQHTHPHHPDLLAPILAKACKLPVSVATHLAELESGRVFVVPPGTHALVTTDNRVALLQSDGPPPYRPSADLLLCSLATAAARRTIAVVLSGTGHDGATGACAVHNFGGIVLASDAASSVCFQMPSAAIGRDDAVDYVLPVTDIASALVALVEQDLPWQGEAP